VNLPGGIQRRRNAVDELNMRQLYGGEALGAGFGVQGSGFRV